MGSPASEGVPELLDNLGGDFACGGAVQLPTVWVGDGRQGDDVLGVLCVRAKEWLKLGRVRLGELLPVREVVTLGVRDEGGREDDGVNPSQFLLREVRGADLVDTVGSRAQDDRCAWAGLSSSSSSVERTFANDDLSL